MRCAAENDCARVLVVLVEGLDPQVMDRETEDYGRRSTLGVCVFITAGPITKLFAGGGGGEQT